MKNPQSGAVAYVYRWFHRAPDTQLTEEERRPFAAWFSWKALEDHRLLKESPVGRKFQQSDVEELIADFEAEMEEWRQEHCAELVDLNKEELFERLNYECLTFLLDEFRRRSRVPECYAAQKTFFSAEVGSDGKRDQREALRVLKPSEGHVSGALQAPEATEVPEVPDHPFRPAEEWLTKLGDWRLQVLSLLVGDPEKFEVLMIALAGETLKIPRRTQQKLPTYQRLQHEHKGERLDQKLAKALDLPSSSASTLKRRQLRPRFGEAEKAHERLKQAAATLAAERKKASHP
jgi:hypothetical protein